MIFRLLNWPCNLVRRLLGWNSPSLAAMGRSDVIRIPGCVWFAIYLAACAAFAWEVTR